MRSIREQYFTTFERFFFEKVSYHCLHSQQKSKRLLRLLLSFDVFKGSVSLVFLILFFMLQAHKGLSEVQNALIISSCIVFVLHIWVVNTCINPIFRNPREYIFARKFAQAKLIFAIFLAVMVVGSMMTQIFSNSACPQKVEMLYFIIIGYEIMDAFVIFTYFLHVKQQVLYRTGPLTGVEYQVSFGFYRAESIPIHGIGMKPLVSFDEEYE